MQTSLELTPVVHPFTGTELRDGGMKVAIDHADLVVNDWSINAGKALDLFLTHHKGLFMAEDVRKYANETLKLELPPSKRAWGGVIQGASKAKKIIFVRIGHVSNPKAHHANAAVWRKA